MAGPFPDTLGVRSTGAFDPQESGRVYVGIISQLGQQAQKAVQTIQTNRQLEGFTQSISGIDPTSPDFDQKMIGAISNYPLATQAPAGQAVINQLGMARKLHEQKELARLRGDVYGTIPGTNALYNKDTGDFKAVPPEMARPGRSDIVKDGFGNPIAIKAPDGTMSPIDKNDFPGYTPRTERPVNLSDGGMLFDVDGTMIAENAREPKGNARDYAWEIKYKSMEQKSQKLLSEFSKAESAMAAANVEVEAALADPNKTAAEKAAAKAKADKMRALAEERRKELQRQDELLKQEYNSRSAPPAPVLGPNPTRADLNNAAPLPQAVPVVAAPSVFNYDPTNRILNPVP